MSDVLLKIRDSLTTLYYARQFGFCVVPIKIVKALRNILLAAEFEIESPLIAWEALREYTSGLADFSDYLIGYKNKNSGCIFTVTLDKKAGETKNSVLI